MCLVFLNRVMLCLVDIPGSPVSFPKGNRGALDQGEREGVKGDWEKWREGMLLLGCIV